MTRIVLAETVVEDTDIGSGAQDSRVVVDAFAQRNTEVDALAAALAQQLVGDLARIEGLAATRVESWHPHKSE